MNHNESNAYILGTERAELQRLGLQHQVWAEEARRGWRRAGFTAGQTLLDLGCGPGFCTQDLAYMVGETGRVVGVDISEQFIKFARALSKLQGLPVEYQVASFDDMVLSARSLDGVFGRWALAWIPNPEEVVSRIIEALRPGGVFVAHEYIDWKTFQTQPASPALDCAIAAGLGSFRDSDGDIDIGRRVPGLFADHGLVAIETRSMAKLARPDELTWHWPHGFFNNYLPKICEAGLLDEATCAEALADWNRLSADPTSVCICPQMIEVIGRKSAE